MYTRASLYYVLLTTVVVVIMINLVSCGFCISCNHPVIIFIKKSILNTLVLLEVVMITHLI